MVISYFFWSTLGKPSWKCFTGDKEYLNDFERRFNRSLTDKPSSFFGKIRDKILSVKAFSNLAKSSESVDSDSSRREKRSSTVPALNGSPEVVDATTPQAKARNTVSEVGPTAASSTTVELTEVSLEERTTKGAACV